jgi:hypothetical protein
MKTESASRKTIRFVPSERDVSWVIVSLIVAKPDNATSCPVVLRDFLSVVCGRLAKRRQLHQIVLRHGFQWFAGLAPGSQAADDHERVESFFPQQVRHPGAGRFARSSTVKINVLVLGEVLDLFLKIVGLDADRAFNPGRS